MKQLFIFLVLCSLLFPWRGISQGLLFNSSDKLIAERTSYNVFAKKRPIFTNSFVIDFDLSIVKPNSFGYIFSVKDKNDDTSYSLAYINNDENSFQLKFNLDGVSNLLTIPLEKKTLGTRKWISVSIFFNNQEKQIEIRLNGKKYTSVGYTFKSNIQPEIYFGKHKSVIDVPAMALKNLTVKEGNKMFAFELNESQGSDVYDTNGNLYGEVTHPNWLINESYHWRHRLTTTSQQVSAISFDKKHQRFIIVNSDSISFYHFRNEQTEREKLKTSSPVPLRLGTSFLDSGTNKLYVYEVNDVLPDRSTIASVDLEKLTWTSQSLLELPQQRHHHNSIFKKEDNKLIIFGGFGNQRLTNEFNSYDLRNDQWKTLRFTGDTISPRFFSGLTKINKKEILVFGGVGNKTGDQSIGKTYYYDCYKVNLDEYTIIKLWGVKRDVSLASSRNMIVSQDSTAFYTLSYPEYIPSSSLQLHKYNIKDGTFKVLGDSIPLISERIRTNANLYHNNETNELFCTIQEFDLNGVNKIKIYSLANPPVSKDTINKYAGKNQKANIDTTLIILGALVAVILLLFIFLKQKKKQKNKLKQIKSLESPSNTFIMEEQKNNAIWLFGDFKVFDKSKKDITYLFSPKIKNLFALLLLNSWKKDPVGIQSREIDNILWPEKPAQKVKNLKNVAINKLRKIIEDIDNLEVVYNQGHFSISFNDNFYCDFFNVIENLDLLNEDSNNNSVIEYLELVSKKGRFLKSIDDSYFDKNKHDFEYELLKVIPQLLKHFYEKKDYAQVVSLTNVICNLDSLNEIAFYYKIHAYLKLGIKEKAKKYYNSFIVEYKKIMGDDFPMTYGEVIVEIPNDLLKS